MGPQITKMVFSTTCLILPIALILFKVHQITCQQQNGTIKDSFQQLSTILAQPPIETSSVYQETNDDNSATLSSSMLKAYIRSNNMRAYHLDLHSYRPKARFVGDPAFVDSNDPKDKRRCSKHLEQYKQLLKSFNELDPVLAKNSLDSLILADSFGRPESGVLSGNQFWLGRYEGCLSFEHKPSNQKETIKSQYCLGITQFPNWNPRDGKTSIKVGLCLPETCTSSMINDDSELLETTETMMKYQFGKGQPFGSIKLREVYCLPHETSQIRQYSTSAIAFWVFIGTFVVSCLIATAIDCLNTRISENLKNQDRTWRTIVIESFSLTRNFEKFWHVRDDEIKEIRPDGSFDKNTFLNSTTGLKCIGLCWIICGHAFLVTPIPSRNILDADKLTRTYLANIYMTAHLMVDTFFAISGLLASYFMFKIGIQNLNATNIIVSTVHRYWRLTPIYLICYWFTKSVGFLTNSGPLWDYMTAEQSPRLNCNRESWFEAILHLSDFKSPKEHCVPFAWFIANGMKFAIVTPIFLILIHRSMRQGYKAIFCTLLANIILVATLALRSNVDVKSVIEFRPESAEDVLNNGDQIYTRPYSRIGAYLIGIVAGHIIYLIDTNQLEVKLSKNAKISIWTLFSVIVVGLTFMLKIANGVQMEDAIMPWVFAACSALVRPLWAMCTCWFIFALAHGQLPWIARFLSASCWRILVKLSFCAYLAQGEVIAQLYLSPSNSESFTYMDMISRSIVITVVTIAASFIMVLVLEYPLTGIEELVLPRRHKDVTPKPSDDVKTQGEKLKCS